MRPAHTPVLTLALLLAGAALHAQDRPRYPEGSAVPRFLTPREAAWLHSHPRAGSRSATAPPPSVLRAPAEYEPTEAILVAWEGSNSWKNILAAMAAQITTAGNADLEVVVDNNGEIAGASSTLAGAGADMNRVSFFVTPTDTIWIRDYGPRTIYQNGVRIVVDHSYNRPRPLDDAMPWAWAAAQGRAIYEMPLEHGGGNYHLDALGDGFTTRLVVNENRNYSEAQIHGIFQAFFGTDTSFFDPLPASVDSTQHIDMWLQVAADDVVVVSDWPAQQGSTQDQLCDAAAADFAARGFQVFRTPARKVGSIFSTHYTYTNVVMCNDVVLVPTYRNSQVSGYNGQALAVWRQACPSKTIVPIDAEDIVDAAGVLHCIVMHVPAAADPVLPAACLLAPNGGESFAAGESVEIQWIGDDAQGLVDAELRLSTDGGATWPVVLAAGLPPSGTWSWTAPATASRRARIQVLVRDTSGYTASDASDADFETGSDLAANFAYGNGKAGTLGVPSLSATAPPVLGAGVTLEVNQALPNGLVHLLRGPATAAIPFDGATVLVAYDHVYDLPVDAAGRAALSGNVPANPALAGVSFYWQAWVPNDPAAAGQGWACSAGLETRLGN